MNNRQLPNQFQGAQLQLFLRKPQGTPGSGEETEATSEPPSLCTEGATPGSIARSSPCSLHALFCAFMGTLSHPPSHSCCLLTTPRIHYISTFSYPHPPLIGCGSPAHPGLPSPYSKCTLKSPTTS